MPLFMLRLPIFSCTIVYNVPLHQKSKPLNHVSVSIEQYRLYHFIFDSTAHEFLIINISFK